MNSVVTASVRTAVTAVLPNIYFKHRSVTVELITCADIRPREDSQIQYGLQPQITQFIAPIFSQGVMENF
ncbi:MAG: hypothetical protein ABIJ45_02445 [Candidatus Zixiibacteriota bacterium]